MIQDNNDVDTIKFFEGVAECLLNDSDTIKDGKIRAKNLAEQNAQQKIVDYIRDFLEFRYLTFPDDEILAITNEILKISNINYGMKDSGGNEMIIQSTVIAQIDDNDIMNCLVGFFNERTELKSENDSLHEEIDSLKRQNESLRKENDTLSAEIDNLKRQNESLRKENEDAKHQIEDLKRQIAELTPQIITKDKIILANQKHNEALELRNKEDDEGAIKLYDEAIQLNPNDCWLYKSRGNFYKDLNQYEKAIQDYSKAIELNPNDYKLYSNRGYAYYCFKQYEKAIQDYSKAIELIPNGFWLYKSRGDCYKALGEETKAQADFAKAKQLGYTDIVKTIRKSDSRLF